MMVMTVEEAALAVDGRLRVRDADQAGNPIGSVVTDSRQAGKGALFVAIAGEHVDGHDFVAKVGQTGAAAALVDHEIADADVPQIIVDDTVKALGLLAKANIERRRAAGTPFTVIGITGSVGKTTTKDLLKALLSSQAPTVAPVGSFNNDIGMPITALQVDEHTRYLVSEMGANHLGEIAYLTSLVRPDIAVVLKVGVAHLGEFGSVENIQKAKSEIVRALDANGLAVLNADDDHVTPMARIVDDRVLWFGMGDGAESKASNVHMNGLDRATFTLALPGQDPIEVNLAIPGRHNVMNALAAATVAWHLGMSATDIAGVLARQSTISPHRMAVSTLSRGGADFTVIDDSFNANPDSMKAGLDGLHGWTGDNANADDRPYRVAVLGSMLELGGDEAGLHRGIGAYAAELGIDAVIAVGSDHDRNLDSLAADIIDGVKSADNAPFAELVHNVDDADRTVIDLAARHPHAVVLLKGSHASGLSALATRWERNDDLPSKRNADGHETTKNGEAL
ncbi:UDP-N-acetylmuramoyl-tripeptide--D-alanyl-D-alanine ligase [Bifidobacterium tissieri]|uniref:UDP-N-acetylmuramoyl-tripeptide--D-alanyl-D-alanine ligase n=1 Tax=Bifidobacterium tissieri TaxID=1630162 RepID=A0A5M9ZYZ3_9BIFI|nr:UDP-N-acetylmuramoyl-tripeptide--D-alanyl-D-alanine ligase [Bifidobacterium tissieri]KAA8832102.1 UDP-N-acetylmuramoyl-tripeptide--D-alanyl-D-alanine ligase [Bifidobacterium tissieri]KAA8832283.1 UDP-N-acetylmuramoyl-tripeptide--D-alanyl-D-alanine ligase [Bifidobacterium tissieri]